MKEWIQELCPEIAEWQVDLISEEFNKLFHITEQFMIKSHEAVLEEREECAKLCAAADKSTHPADLADAIRARGNT